jgi:hypothetical protein
MPSAADAPSAQSHPPARMGLEPVVRPLAEVADPDLQRNEGISRGVGVGKGWSCGERDPNRPPSLPLPKILDSNASAGHGRAQRPCAFVESLCLTASAGYGRAQRLCECVVMLSVFLGGSQVWTTPRHCRGCAVQVLPTPRLLVPALLREPAQSPGLKMIG